MLREDQLTLRQGWTLDPCTSQQINASRVDGQKEAFLELQLFTSLCPLMALPTRAFVLGSRESDRK